ncbi:relaxase/mobilization nuclease domain-containing protein [Flavitalea flava]
MMGRVYTQAKISEALGYCLEDKLDVLTGEVLYKDRAEVLNYSQCYGDKEELIRQFQEVRKLRPGIKEPIMHITLSLPRGETRGKGDWVDFARDCAEAMEFSHNQYVVVLHKDTAQQHIHIVVNRIGFYKKTVSDSFSKGRIADYSRASEIKHGLIKELGPSRYLKKEQGQRKRSGIRLDRLKEEIADALNGCRDLNEFERTMRQNGYTVYKSQGYAFMDSKKVVYKGSEAGYPFRVITGIIKENREKLAQKENNWIQQLHQKEKEATHKQNLLDQQLEKEHLLKEHLLNEDLPKETLPKEDILIEDLRKENLEEEILLREDLLQILPSEAIRLNESLAKGNLATECLTEENLAEENLAEENQQTLTHHFKIRGL